MTSENSTPATGLDTAPGEECYYAVKPNQMTYIDDKGASRTIHIPRGRHQEACKHFENEDWEALSKFPEWTGSAEQQYSKEDYVKMPKESKEI